MGGECYAEPHATELTFNERLVIISDIFKKMKLLGMDKKGLNNPRWWNNTFDNLYELNGDNLMQYDTHLRDIAIEKFGVIQV